MASGSRGRRAAQIRPCDAKVSSTSEVVRAQPDFCAAPRFDGAARPAIDGEVQGEGAGVKQVQRPDVQRAAGQVDATGSLRDDFHACERLAGSSKALLYRRRYIEPGREGRWMSGDGMKQLWLIAVVSVIGWIPDRAGHTGAAHRKQPRPLRRSPLLQAARRQAATDARRRQASSGTPKPKQCTRRQASEPYPAPQLPGPNQHGRLDRRCSALR